MTNPQEVKDFLSKVDSIQSKFIESLITGQRDAIFKEKGAEHKPESRGESLRTHIDSQRVGTK
jgi:hypothetical protein